jgi:hypothetical protein
MPAEEYLEARLEKKKDVFCLPYDIEVIIPDMCVEHCPLALELIRNRMHDLFGGTTVIRGVGSWRNENTKQDVVESVAIIKSSHACTDKETLEELERTVGEAAAQSGQISVAVRAGKLYLLPPGSLITSAKFN